MRIVDCFTFYNEFRMLDFRLEELRGAVDDFVLVESDRTFAGSPKGLLFREARDRYAGEPITHVEVLDMPAGESAWEREYWQRNSIDRGLRRLRLADDDVVIISDADEVPDPETLTSIRRDGLDGPRCMEQDLYYYSLRFRHRHAKWHHPKIMPYGFYKTLGGPQHARSFPSDALPRGGWHFSYFGDSEFIANKIRSFSHQEFNVDRFTDPAWIESRIADGSDLYGRGDEFDAIEPESNPYLPRNWKMLS